jgi:hypothetical protein
MQDPVDHDLSSVDIEVLQHHLDRRTLNCGDQVTDFALHSQQIDGSTRLRTHGG